MEMGGGGTCLAFSANAQVMVGGGVGGLEGCKISWAVGESSRVREMKFEHLFSIKHAWSQSIVQFVVDRESNVLLGASVNEGVVRRWGVDLNHLDLNSQSIDSSVASLSNLCIKESGSSFQPQPGRPIAHQTSHIAPVLSTNPLIESTSIKQSIRDSNNFNKGEESVDLFYFCRNQLLTRFISSTLLCRRAGPPASTAVYHWARFH